MVGVNWGAFTFTVWYKEEVRTKKTDIKNRSSTTYSIRTQQECIGNMRDEKRMRAQKVKKKQLEKHGGNKLKLGDVNMSHQYITAQRVR